MKTLVLVGAGQSHLYTLRALAQARPDADIVLVTPTDRLLYSGMLPGWIAGHYRLDELSIPIEPLARAAGASMVLERAVALDPDRRVLTTDHGTHIAYDVLSIASGPVVDLDAIPGAHRYALPIRPLEVFVQGWQRIDPHGLGPDIPVRVTVVGAGAGGVELALAMAHRIRSVGAAARVQLVTGDGPILPAHPARARRLLQAALLKAGVRLTEGMVQQVELDGVVIAGDTALPSDVTVLATGAAAEPWPRAAGLDTDARGFIAVSRTLQSISHPNVFAAGDAAELVDSPRPKSGVYAVRSGQVLAHNVAAAVAGRGPASYRPQRVALYLISTGPKHAVASWGPLAWAGRWVWRWKDRIDRGYIAQYGNVE